MIMEEGTTMTTTTTTTDWEKTRQGRHAFICPHPHLPGRAEWTKPRCKCHFGWWTGGRCYEALLLFHTSFCHPSPGAARPEAITNNNTSVGHVFVRTRPNPHAIPCHASMDGRIDGCPTRRPIHQSSQTNVCESCRPHNVSI